MALKYTSIGAIQKALVNRIRIVDDLPPGEPVKGQTKTQIGLDLVLEFGEEVEIGFIDTFLGMLYELPLLNNHPYINSIARDLIIAKIMNHVMPFRTEDPLGQDSFAVYYEKNALARFNSLFLGTGITIPNLPTETPNINDENRIKQPQKPLILPGERLKGFIGYDYNKDGVSDTNLFKNDPIRQDSYWVQGDYNSVNSQAFIESGVRTRRYRNIPSDRDIQEIIDFF